VLIRKLFKFEAAHVVRNCERSRRCSFNIHGHSFIVELKLGATVNDLDRAAMVKDFGALHEVKHLIDKFDHAYILGPDDSVDFRSFIMQHNERWIQLPVNPSAEALAVLLFGQVSALPSMRGLHVHSVTVHETATGYAEAFHDDWLAFVAACDSTDVIYSEPGKDYVYE